MGMTTEPTYRGIPLSRILIEAVVWTDDIIVHLATRTIRYQDTETNLCPEWASEAVMDPGRRLFIPNTGTSLGVIGWSDAVQLVLKVWLQPVDMDGWVWAGTSAAKTNTDHHQPLLEREPMTDKDLATTLREEAELFDAEDDDDVAEAVWVRPAPPRDPSQVYSVRIPVGELEKLRRVAEHKGVTPSALMRTWVLIRLDAEYEDMLGICPRCGRPAETEPAAKVRRRVATAAAPKKTTATKKGAAKAAPRVRSPS